MNKRTRPNAFSLVEVVFAMAIFVFAGFALVGLLSVGLQSTQDSKERTQAATIVEALCSIRRAAPTNDFSVASSPLAGFPLPYLNQTSPNSSLTVPTWITRDGVITNAASADFGFLYSITQNTTTHTSSVYMCVYWPPPASPTAASTRHFELTTTFALP